MKNYYNALSSAQKVAPTTGLRIATLANGKQYSGHDEHPEYQWQGSPLGALCSKKLWSILQTLSHSPGTVDCATENAINAELIARGDHASAARWQAPH